MLTSTDAANSRFFAYAIRDAVDVAQVDAFMDRLIGTLYNYEQTGRLHPQGFTADELLNFRFHTTFGQGYSRSEVDHLRYLAVAELRAYEQSLAGGSLLNKPLTRINRVKRLAPNVSLAQVHSANLRHPATAPVPSVPAQVDYDAPIPVPGYYAN